jgi:hypothetical protein
VNARVIDLERSSAKSLAARCQKLSNHDRDIQMLQLAACELQKANAKKPDERCAPIPFNDRVNALMGGLGWDDDRVLIEDRAREVLVAAEVDSQTQGIV